MSNSMVVAGSKSDNSAGNGCADLLGRHSSERNSRKVCSLPGAIAKFYRIRAA